VLQAIAASCARQPVHPVEGLADAASRHQRPVIPEDHGFPVTKVADQGFFFGRVEDHALVVVIADLEEAHRRLGDGQEAAFQRRDGHRRPAVDVDDARDIVTRLVDRAVDDVSGLVDAIIQSAEIGPGQDLSIEVHLDQAGGGDFLVQHAVGIDQERAGFSGHAGRDVIGDHVRHAIERDQPVAGGQVDARLPFFGWAGTFKRGDIQFVGVHGETGCSWRNRYAGRPQSR
jgi:hypothetical protein